jgi:hypothetical protein
VSYTKACFIQTDLNHFPYLNPENEPHPPTGNPIQDGRAYGLSFSLRDATSTRSYNDKTVNLDLIGSPRFPTMMDPPMLILPRSNIEVLWTNNNPAYTYIPFITFLGYRIRIDQADKIRSLVSMSPPAS